MRYRLSCHHGQKRAKVATENVETRQIKGFNFLKQINVWRMMKKLQIEWDAFLIESIKIFQFEKWTNFKH